MITSKADDKKLTDYIVAHSSKVLFIEENGTETTYQAVLDLAEQDAFKQTHRRLVFCFCSNESSSLTAYFALLHVGAIPFLLAPNLSDEQADRLMQAYQPDYILQHSRAVGNEKYKMMANFGEVDLLKATELASYQVNENLALLLSTSGSTGNPKLVRLSHDNICSNAEAIASYLELECSQIPITTLPPYYAFGLSVLHSHIVAGCTTALTEKTLFDREFWAFLKSVEATSIAGVPYHYEMMKRLRFFKMELPSLKTLVQAGGRMQPDLQIEFAKHCIEKDKRLYVMYGQTEAAPRMSYLPPDKTREKLGSIGVPIPGIELDIIDENGQKINGPDVQGELVCRGRNIFMGYADSAQDLNNGDDMKGILKTGDIASKDCDGFYYLHGRMSRFLKIYGNRVNLQDVEQFLQNQGYKAVCGGKDDQLKVYIEGNHGLDDKSTDDFVDKIKTEISNKMFISLQAITIIAIDNIPYLETGKIDYQELSLVSDKKN